MFILLSDKRYVYKPVFRFISSKSQQKVKVKFSNDLVLSFGERFKKQMNYFTHAAEAAFMSLNHYDKSNHTFHVELDLISLSGEGINLQDDSSSVGLGYALGCALAMRTQLKKHDHIDARLFVTGEISPSGNIHRVGSIAAKIKGAIHATHEMQKNGGETQDFVIIYPKENEPDISAELKLALANAGGRLLGVSHLSQALESLLGDAFDGGFEHRVMTFKGLTSFGFDDKSYFFGRDEEIRSFVNLYKESPNLLKIYGVSGSGKSSLIKAGVLPALLKENNALKWEVITPNKFTSSIHLIKSLLTSSSAPLIDLTKVDEFALTKLVRALLKGTPSAFAKIKQYSLDKSTPIVWYIDQFEEIYALNFNDELLSVLDKLSHIFPVLRVIVSARSEYIHHLPLVGQDFYLDQSLTPSSWHAIINKQAMSFGIQFENGLASHIQACAMKMSHALPALEYLLTQMHSLALQSDNGKRLTFEHFKQVGGLIGVITEQAEHILKEHDKHSAAFFETFVGIDYAMQPYAKSVNLLQLEASNHTLYTVTNALIGKQLVIKIRSNEQTPYVKIAHDCLIQLDDKINVSEQLWPIFFTWFTERKKYLVWLNHIESRFLKWQSFQHGAIKKTHHLLNNTDLAEGIQFLNQAGIISQQSVRDYITASHIYQKTLLEQDNNKQRKRVLLFCGLFFISTVFAFTAAYNMTQSKLAKQQAEKLLLLVRGNVLHNINELSPFITQYIPTKERQKVSDYIEHMIEHLDEMHLSSAERIRFLLIKVKLMQDFDSKDGYQINDLLNQIETKIFFEQEHSANTSQENILLQAKLCLEFGKYLQLRSKREKGIEYFNRGLTLLAPLTHQTTTINQSAQKIQAQLLSNLGQFYIGTEHQQEATRHFKAGLASISLINRETSQIKLLRANLYRKLARVEVNDKEKSALLNKAQREFNAILNADPNNLNAIYNLARIYINMAEHNENNDEKKTLYEKALEITSRLYQLDNNHVDYQAMLININKSLGNLLRDKKEYNLAQNYFNKALEIINILTNHSPDNTEWIAMKVDLMLSMGRLLRSQKIFEKAQAHFTKAQSAIDQLIKIDPSDLDFHELQMSGYSEQAYFSFEMNNIDESVVLFKKALHILKYIKAQAPSNVFYLENEAKLLSNLAYLLSLNDVVLACSYYKNATKTVAELIELKANNKSLISQQNMLQEKLTQHGC